MKIEDYGFFKAEDGSDRVLYFVNERGEDWYDLRRQVMVWNRMNGDFVSSIFPTWAACDKDGYITNVEYDPSRLMPSDRRVLGIDAPLSDVKVGQKYEGGRIS
jgi:hypothetical protein